jgi:hypothetical protein
MISAIGIAAAAHAQGGMIGIQAGVGYTIGNKGYVTPTAEGYFLKKITYHFYAGGALSFQRYSLQKEFKNDDASASYGDLLSIRQKSTYFFVCPKLDLGVGYRNYYHLYFAFGPGFYAGGGQWYYTREPQYTTSAGQVGSQTVATNTTYNVRNVVMRVTAGITERIPTLGVWSIVLSQEFTYLPGALTNGGESLHGSYLAITAGIMHKYPQVWVEH